jgi:hypothetical protein
MEQKLKQVIGDQVFAIVALQIQLETANKEIAELKKNQKTPKKK